MNKKANNLRATTVKAQSSATIPFKAFDNLNYLFILLSKFTKNADQAVKMFIS